MLSSYRVLVFIDEAPIMMYGSVIGELANDIFRIQRFQICCIHDESRWSDSGSLDDAGCECDDLKC